MRLASFPSCLSFNSEFASSSFSVYRAGLVFNAVSVCPMTVSWKQFCSVLSYCTYLDVKRKGYCQIHWYEVPAYGVSNCYKQTWREKTYLTTSAHCVLAPQRFHFPGLVKIVYLLSRGILAFLRSLPLPHFPVNMLPYNLVCSQSFGVLFAAHFKNDSIPSGPFISKNVRTIK